MHRGSDSIYVAVIYRDTNGVDVLDRRLGMATVPLPPGSPQDLSWEEALVSSVGALLGKNGRRLRGALPPPKAAGAPPSGGHGGASRNRLQEATLQDQVPGTVERSASEASSDPSLEAREAAE